MLTPM